MTLRLTEEEYAALMRRRADTPTPYQPSTSNLQPPASNSPPRKYRNTPTTVDGLRFDSKREADTYLALLAQYQAGDLTLLIRQAPFDLPGGIRYIADFVVVEKSGRVRVIDVKSPATAKNRTYINKKKQMKAIWHIDIEER